MSRSHHPTWMREELLQLLAVAGTLAGLSITAVALLHTLGHANATATVADDIALRTRKPRVAHLLERAADALFLLALTGMVAAGFVMVYTLW